MSLEIDWWKLLFCAGERLTSDWASGTVERLSEPAIAQLVDFALNNMDRSYGSGLRLKFLAKSQHRSVAETLIEQLLILPEKVKADTGHQDKALQDNYDDLRGGVLRIPYAMRTEIILTIVHLNLKLPPSIQATTIFFSSSVLYHAMSSPLQANHEFLLSK